jgi:hypothetical protein
MNTTSTNKNANIQKSSHTRSFPLEMSTTPTPSVDFRACENGYAPYNHTIGLLDLSLAVISLAIHLIGSLVTCKKRNQDQAVSRLNDFQLPTRAKQMILLGGVATSVCGIALAARAIQEESSTDDDFFILNMGLVQKNGINASVIFCLGFFLSINFHRYWLLISFEHLIWLMGLPQREGNIDVLMANAKLELQARQKRRRVGSLLLIAGSLVAFLIATSASNRVSSFIRVVAILTFLFIIFDLGCLVAVVRLKILARNFKNKRREFGSRILWGFVVSSADLVVVIVAYMNGYVGFNGSPRPFTEIMSGSHDDDTFENGVRHCFGHWILMMLMPPILLGSVVYGVVYGQFSPRDSCKGIAQMLRRCADGAESTGDFLEDTLSSFCHYHAHAALFDLIPTGAPAVETAQADLSGEGEILRQLGTILDGVDTDPMIIPHQFIQVKKVIAAGGFAQVFAGTYTGKRCAVKMLTSSLQETPEAAAEFNHEVRMLNNLKGNPYVVTLHGVALDDSRGFPILLMVMEYCAQSLDSILYPQRNHRRMSRNASMSSLRSSTDSSSRASGASTYMVDHSLFLAIAKQLVNALQMIHYKGYVHLDLKPANIMFTANPANSLKLCGKSTCFCVFMLCLKRSRLLTVESLLNVFKTLGRQGLRIAQEDVQSTHNYRELPLYMPHLRSFCRRPWQSHSPESELEHNLRAFPFNGFARSLQWSTTWHALCLLRWLVQRLPATAATILISMAARKCLMEDASTYTA